MINMFLIPIDLSWNKTKIFVVTSKVEPSTVSKLLNNLELKLLGAPYILRVCDLLKGVLYIVYLVLNWFIVVKRVWLTGKANTIFMIQGVHSTSGPWYLVHTIQDSAIKLPGELARWA